MPSRPTSPSRLRSRPSVAVTAYDARSDQVERLAEHAALLSEALDGIGEDIGWDLEVSLPPLKPVWTTRFADEPLIDTGISDYTFIHPDQGGLLGRGKFSSVQLAWKDGQKYAVKITPLYPHHHLIATRLLREPTILAQLPLHPNLVRVHESIRTPGYFYLVEEFLDGYTNLESFVAAQPGQRLSLSQSTYIFHQLVSVVRSALHEPIQIAHRDIKPENILIHPETLHITLLDFGLATHFSWREPKLTTCCGSPAFHAPELFLSLKSSPGSVRYWGPEIDIWTIGMTILRCMIGVKYPLGVSHTSVQHMSDKTIDALLNVEDKPFRKVLAGLLDMDGERRMKFFQSLDDSIDRAPFVNGYAAKSGEREFKNVSFIPAEPKHTLPMPLMAVCSGANTPVLSPTLPPNALPTYPRSSSRDRLTAALATGLVSAAMDTDGSMTPRRARKYCAAELLMQNPTGEPCKRAISFVKYALRCAGILYHIQGISPTIASQTDSDAIDILDTAQPPRMKPLSPLLHCVLVLPKEKPAISQAEALLTQLRPPLQRAQSAQQPRSSSTPPARLKTSSAAKKTEPTKYRCLEFWLQIIPVYAIESRANHASTQPSRRNRNTSRASSPARKRNGAASKSRTRIGHPHAATEDERNCTKLRIRISDEQALPALIKALSIGSTALSSQEQTTNGIGEVAEDSTHALEVITISAKEENRGRSTLSRSISSAGSHSKSPPSTELAVCSTKPKTRLSRPQLVHTITEAAAPAKTAHRTSGSSGSSYAKLAQKTTESPSMPTTQLPLQRSIRSFFDLVTFSKRSASVGPSPMTSPQLSSSEEFAINTATKTSAENPPARAVAFPAL